MASRDPDRPNILFILSDDQGCWALGCAGNTEIRTPHLDKIAASGMRFENFFCASPVCSPARASILTGRIPSRHGIHDWLSAGNTAASQEPAGGGALIEYLRGQPAYTELIAAAGYTCGLSGKWHLGDCHHPQKSFSFWETHAKGGGPYYKAPMIHNGELYEEPRYVTEVIADNALKFLAEHSAQNNPFYLSVHFTAPHSPWDRANHPPELYDSYHAHCPFHSVPAGVAQPAWARSLTIPVRDEATRRAHLSGYFAAVTGMDHAVGRLLEWLEKNGLRQNTLVIFTSDNGMNMGHHGVYGKGNATYPMNMFEESVKVPFLLSRPGQVPQGTVCRELLSHYDLFPTLLDYLKLPNPEADRLPGRSFAQILRGEDYAARERVVVYDEYGPVRMIRTREWKLVRRFTEGPDELYDLAHDPGETTNRLADPTAQKIAVELRAELDAWFSRYSDPARDGKFAPVTGNGQIALYNTADSQRKTFVPLK